jgi:hypothetical protein
MAIVINCTNRTQLESAEKLAFDGKSIVEK